MFRRSRWSTVRSCGGAGKGEKVAWRAAGKLPGSTSTIFTWGICCGWRMIIPRRRSSASAMPSRSGWRTPRRTSGSGRRSVFTDYRECLERTKPDMVILCPSTATHAEWVEEDRAVRRAPAHGKAVRRVGRRGRPHDRGGQRRPASALAINWPMRWYPTHALAYELATRQRLIGEIIEVHYCAGNRGPLYHGADKIVLEPTPERKAASWFYKKSEGGGAMLDYMGYGTTLGTWYLGGRKPLEVSCVTWATPGLEVDEHAIAVARYAFGLSKFETRWGTFTDPWVMQPQPKCGFVLKGTDGTLASYDAEDHVRVQTRDCPEGRDVPAPPLEAPLRNPIEYFLDCLGTGAAVEGRSRLRSRASASRSSTRRCSAPRPAG